MCHSWHVEKAIVGFPIRLKGNFEMHFQLLLSLWGAQSKDLGTALQTLLTEIRLHLQCRLEKKGQTEMNHTVKVFINFCSWAGRKSQIFQTNHMLSSEHWAPFNFR